VKQLEDGYVRFVSLSFCFICAKFCPFWCRHVKVTANDRVGRFFGTRCISVLHLTRMWFISARKLYRALYDYAPRQADDLGFKKGDRMEVIGSKYVFISILCLTARFRQEVRGHTPEVAGLALIILLFHSEGSGLQSRLTLCSGRML